MKKKLTHNLGLKIASILIAICLWIIAVNINDPISQRVYTVSVQLLNMNTLTNAGKYVEVLDNTDTVRVTVRASRSVFSDFTEKNIVATADVSKLTEDNLLPIEVSSSKTGSKIESIKADKEFVEVSVEDVMKLQKRISVEVLNEPAEGYLLGTISTDQNAVIISGPESVVNKIAKTQVEINVDGATSDVNITLPVHLYDADGHEIDDSRLTTSVKEVFATASVLQRKEVPIEYSVKGEPAEGYIFAGEYIKTPQTIAIAAKPSVLKNVNSIVVEDAIDIEGASDDVQMAVELRQYLPDGVILADGYTSGDVSVSAVIEEEKVRIFEIPFEQITLTNVPEGYRARLRGQDDTVIVKIVGFPATVDTVTSESLLGNVDVTAYLLAGEGENFKEGSYYPSASFTLPDYVRLKESVTVHMILEEQ